MTQSEIEIVPAAARDLERIASIEAANTAHGWTRAQFAAELSYEYANLLAARCGDTAVGYVDFHTVAGDAHINAFAVDESFRRRGIGKMLAEQAIEFCRRAGCDVLTLEVRARNTAARKLYEKVGFRAAGMRRGFYREPDDDAVNMIMYLEAEDC